MPSAKERLAGALGFKAAAPRARHLPLFTFAIAGAAVLILATWHSAPQFVARGRGPLGATAELHIVRVGADGKPTAVRDSITPRDEIGFTYRNPSGKKRLLVFASDEHGHLYWYHPAWTRETDDPVAIPIQGGDGSYALAEVVAHEYDGRSLQVHALFTDAALSVKNVEALSKQAAWPAGTIDLVIPLRVQQ
jgi:hypothetical protein